MTAGLLFLVLASVTTGGGDDAQLLCFGATWCGPCREMKPVLDDLTQAGYPLAKIDVDQKAELAKRYEVSAVPSFVLVNGRGQVIDRIDKATSRETLGRMLAYYKVRPRQREAAEQNNSTQPFLARGQNPIAVPDLKTQIPINNQAPLTAVPSQSNAQTLGVPSAFGSSSDVGAVRATAPANIHSAADTPNYEDRSTGPPTEHAKSCTVRLKVEDEGGHSFGTGTVIDVHGQEALVLTCGHIFRTSKGKGRILMDRFDSPTSEPTVGSLINYDMDLDVALVSMKLTRPIKVAKLAPLAYQAKKGEGVFSVGCSRGDPPTIMNGQVNQIDKYLGPPNITASGRPVDGRSGGGLFNAAGELIGVCSAADPEIDEGLYGALPRVYYELDRNGLTFVYDGSSDNEQPIASVATTSRDLTGIAAPPPAASNTLPPQPSSATNSPPTTTVNKNDELVCVLKDQEGGSNVFVIKNPSRTLIEYLAREAEKK